MLSTSSTSSSHPTLHPGLPLGPRARPARGQEWGGQFRCKVLGTWCTRRRARAKGWGLLMSRGDPLRFHHPSTTGEAWRCLCTHTKEEVRAPQCKCSRWEEGTRERRRMRMARDRLTLHLPRAQATRGLEVGLG